MQTHDEMRSPVRASPSRRAAPLLLGAALLASAACRAVEGPLPPLSDEAVRLDLPLVRQDALYDCGLASISALCQYWGLAIPEQERAALAAAAEQEAGLSGGELCGALQRLGLETYLFRGTLDRAATGLYGQIDNGRPPLVMLAPASGQQHYCLVLGYDEPRAKLILLDPSKGEIAVPAPIFERNWERCERFTLLALRRDVEPADVLRPQTVAGAAPPAASPTPAALGVAGAAPRNPIAKEL